MKGVDDFGFPFGIFSLCLQKELEELAAFEMLEEAADDSSFCSSSSKVKNLITSASTDAMPSPIAKSNMASSTPKRNGIQKPGL